MKRVDAALVALAVVLAVVWYVLRMAPSAPEPSFAGAGPVPAASATPVRRPGGAEDTGAAAGSAAAPGAPVEAPAVGATVEVVHKHKLGSCRGRLSATAAGLRYEPSRPGDGFDVPRTAVERVEADPRKKVLVVKLRGGRTYNFIDPAGRAEPLQAFQKAFAKAPPRAAQVP